MSFLSLGRQLFVRPSVPKTDFSGKTIVITGANSGLGKEAVKHFVRLNAARIVMAVRSMSKGEAARTEILATPGLAEKNCQILVWPLNYGVYGSVEAFGARVAKELDRVDAVILNAGIATQTWKVVEQDESQITVNVVSTTMLGLLCLPALRRSAGRFGTETYLCFVGSGVHANTTFPEQSAGRIFAELRDEKTARMGDRYNVSKLLELFAAREIANRTKDPQPLVIVNYLTPGFCATDLSRDLTGMAKHMMGAMQSTFAWSSEQGSRTLVLAATAGKESHGAYLSDGVVYSNSGQAAWITTPQGAEVQKKVWKELSEKLEKILPGVTKI